MKSTSSNPRRPVLAVLSSLGMLMIGSLCFVGGNVQAGLTPGWTPLLNIQNIVVEADGALVTDLLSLTFGYECGAQSCDKSAIKKLRQFFGGNRNA